MVTGEDKMIENIAIKKIRFLNKKKEEYKEHQLVNKAQEGCDESFGKLINTYKEYLYKTAFYMLKMNMMHLIFIKKQYIRHT